ncbi:MAG TPA: putative lipid II flippase FtsW [Acidimicrobiales bacterium]|jgi:cell division protein FtsW|nr:putative lipid II flippase FtsW [Acidimicrobiales bacterium]
MSDVGEVTRLADFERARTVDQSRWGDGRLVLLALMTVLCLIGLVMVLSASTVESLRQYGSPWYYFERQALWLGLGTAAFAVTWRVDYHRWRRFGVIAVAVCLVLLVAVLLPGAGVAGGGSARWIGLGSWRLQPSELAKLSLALFAADVLDRRSHRIREWRYGMVPVLLAFGAMAVLIMAQPDMGTTVILAFIVAAALFVAGAPMRPLAAAMGAGAVAAFVAAKASPYRWQRMTAFLHPFAQASNAGYQSAQSLVALGSGHLLGMGLGASRAATGYLPNQYTDFIYAIIGEETGLLGTLMVAGLFVALAVVGIRVACRARDCFGSVLVAAITAWLVGEAVINIGAVVGLLPVTGVPLPFVSYGGSSLVIAMGAIGICANVAKQGVRASHARGGGRATADVAATEGVAAPVTGPNLVRDPAASRGRGATVTPIDAARRTAPHEVAAPFPRGRSSATVGAGMRPAGDRSAKPRR